MGSIWGSPSREDFILVMRLECNSRRSSTSGKGQCGQQSEPGETTAGAVASARMYDCNVPADVVSHNAVISAFEKVGQTCFDSLRATIALSRTHGH